MKKALVIAAALLALATTVYADVNMFGSTGLIWTPTDQVTEKSALDLGVNYFDTVADVWTVGASYGLLPKLEIGVGYYDQKGSGSDFLVNAKYNLFKEDKYPGLSVGVTDIFSDSAFTDDPSFYVVAGKQFGPVRATLGFGTETHKGIFGGIQWDVTDKFSVLAEYVHRGFYWEHNVNLAAQYKFNDKFSVKAGVVDEDDFFVGVNFGTSVF